MDIEFLFCRGKAIKQLVKVCSDRMGICSANIDLKLHGNFNLYVNRSTD